MIFPVFSAMSINPSFGEAHTCVCVSQCVHDTRARPPIREVPGAVPGVTYFTLTSICFGFASSAFGSVTVKMPSLNTASILSACTVVGSVNERWKLP